MGLVLGQQPKAWNAGVAAIVFAFEAVSVGKRLADVAAKAHVDVLLNFAVTEIVFHGQYLGFAAFFG